MVRSGTLERHVTSLADIDAMISADKNTLDMQVERGGVRRWHQVPLLIESDQLRIGRTIVGWLVVSLLAGLSVAILVASAAPSVPPFAVFFTCLSVVLTWFLFGYQSETLSALARPGYSALPAAAMHLAMTFPRRREVVRRVPRIVCIPYVISAGLMYLGFVTVHRSPAVWAIVDRLIFLLTIAAAGLHVAGCALSVRESDSSLERARSRVILMGAFCAFVVPLALHLSLGSAIPGASMLLPIVGVAMIPAFLGYAIVRHHLFDLAVNFRKVVATGVYLTAVAALAALFSSILIPRLDTDASPEVFPSVLASVASALLLAELPRAVLRRAFADFSLPWEERLSGLEHRYAETAIEFTNATQAVEALGHVIREALAPQWVSLYVVEGAQLRLVYGAGPRALAHLPLETQRQILRNCKFTQFDRDDDFDPLWAFELTRKGVEILAPIHRGHDVLAIALVAARESESAYNRVHCGFIQRASTQCALAIYTARQTARIISNERYAAVGRVGANLAHEMKPLGSIAIGARQILSDVADRELVRENAEMIQRLASQMRAFMVGLLDNRGASRGPFGRGQSIDPVEAIRQAIDLLEPAHGRNRVSVRLPNQVPSIAGSPEFLIGAISPLLENALLSCSDSDVVEVILSIADDSVEIRICDSGSGIPPDIIEQVFEPYFTTREPSCGTGLGLPIAHDLVSRLGGKIALHSIVNAGTTVSVSLPSIQPRTADDLREDAC